MAVHWKISLQRLKGRWGLAKKKGGFERGVDTPDAHDAYGNYLLILQ